LGFSIVLVYLCKDQNVLGLGSISIFSWGGYEEIPTLLGLYVELVSYFKNITTIDGLESTCVILRNEI
jgi:hypothetical protein